MRLIRSGSGRHPQDLPVVVLHGWGAHIEAVQSIISSLAGETEVLALDLPGFGRSEEPPEAWTSELYAEFVGKVLDRMGIARCHVIGHSAGGRIAICLAAGRPELVDRMILCDSAGIPPRRGFRYRRRVAIAKAGRVLGRLGPLGRSLQDRLRRKVGSADYLAASPRMRETLRNVVSEDWTSYLTQIEAPCMLIWGSRDEDTPIWMGEEMERLLPDAALVVFDGAGHFAYADEPVRFAAIARRFLCVQPREVAAEKAVP
ncbi:MAG: alpha/beta hydrolase [Actinobacteria bacterium]|nr:alpha/beta hydrolase [Actinomycetota bacterium]